MISPSLLTKFRKTGLTEDFTHTDAEIRSKDDEDARFGHKTTTSTFYGYKNHLAMTEERLIVGIHVTSGGVPYGQQLPEIIGKSTKNEIEVTEIVNSRKKARVF